MTKKEQEEILDLVNEISNNSFHNGTIVRMANQYPRTFQEHERNTSDIFKKIEHLLADYSNE